MPDRFDRLTGRLVDSTYGIPREEISCPGCGLKYGHHRTKVCIKCEECSKCCRCGVEKINPYMFIENYVMKNL